MNQHVSIIIPDFFELDGLKVLEVTVNEQDPNIAFVMVGDNLDEVANFKPVIRYYVAQRFESNYKVTKEVDAFVFETAEAAYAFVEEKKANPAQLMQKNEKENELLFT